jgi:hypothetical protein
MTNFVGSNNGYWMVGLLLSAVACGQAASLGESALGADRERDAAASEQAPAPDDGERGSETAAEEAAAEVDAVDRQTADEDAVGDDSANESPEPADESDGNALPSTTDDDGLEGISNDLDEMIDDARGLEPNPNDPEATEVESDVAVEPIGDEATTEAPASDESASDESGVEEHVRDAGAVEPAHDAATPPRSCEELECGQECSPCEEGVVCESIGLCNASGECVVERPACEPVRECPDLCVVPDECSLCDDESCAEPRVGCNDSGGCVIDWVCHEPVPECEIADECGPYDGDAPCLVCSDETGRCPQMGCVEGRCEVVLPECPPSYEPCVEKVDGEECTLCAPEDPDCFEIGVLKVCTEGECVTASEIPVD